MKYNVVYSSMGFHKNIEVDTNSKIVKRDGEQIFCNISKVVEHLDNITKDWEYLEPDFRRTDVPRLVVEIMEDNGKNKKYDYYGNFPKNIGELFDLFEKFEECELVTPSLNKDMTK